MIITFLPIALALPLCWCLQYLTSPNPPCGGAAGEMMTALGGQAVVLMGPTMVPRGPVAILGGPVMTDSTDSSSDSFFVADSIDEAEDDDLYTATEDDTDTVSSNNDDSFVG